MADELPNGAGAEKDVGAETRPIAVQRKASELRVQARSAERKRRWMLIGVGVVVLAIVVVSFIAALVDGRDSAYATPANLVDGGIVIGAQLAAGSDIVAASSARAASDTSGGSQVAVQPTVSVTAFLDYDCAECSGFILANGEQLRGWVSSGRVSLEIVPVAQSQSQYSIEATNAAACVATFAPDSFFDFNSAMFAVNDVGTLTRDTEQIVAVAADAVGVENADVSACIRDQTYKVWAANESGRDLEDASSSASAVRAIVPQVFVNGLLFEGDVADSIEFSTFVSHAESETVAPE